MPTKLGRDSKGCFARWGSSGTKYYYTCGDEASRNRAKKKADKQGRAVYSSGYRSN